MRNLKKLFAVVMVVAMLASIMVPALAAESYEAEAKMLRDLGLFQGYGDGSLGLGDDLTREQALALMLRVMGLEDDVKAMSDEEVAEQMARVVDPETVTETWARPYVAYAVKNGLTKGIDASILPNVKFAGQLKVTGKEFINFILNGMGYEADWDDVLNMAARVEMLEPGDVLKFAEITAMKRDDAVGVMASALTGITAAGVTLAEALVEAGAVDEDKMVEYGFITPTVAPTEAPVELAVEDAVALNLKQIAIVFNKPVDKDSAQDESNYSLKGDYKLQDDGVTVIGTLKTAASNQSSKDLTIKGVEDVDGYEIAKTEVKIDFLDMTIPEVVNAEVVGKDTVKVTFSEPLKVDGASASDLRKGFSLKDANGKNVYVNKVTFNDSNDVANVVFYSSFKEGVYTLTVNNEYKDYAGYTVVKETFELEVVPDEEGPEVIGYEDAKPYEVTLIFNEDIALVNNSLVDKDGDPYFYHTNTKNGVSGLNKEGEVKVTDGNKLKLIFTEKDKNEMPSGTVYVYIAKEAIKDLWDNKNEQQIMVAVEVEGDNEAPYVEKVEATSQNELKVTFNEKLQPKSAQDRSNYTLLDKDGKEIKSIIRQATLDDKVVKLSLREDISGEYTLVVEGVKDLYKNEMSKQSITFVADDATAPDFANVEVTLHGDNEYQTLIINYDDVMATEGAYSVLDLEKYRVQMEKYVDKKWNGEFKYVELADIEDGIEIAISEDGKKVEIELDTEDAGYRFATGKKIQIARVADAAGNRTAALSSPEITIKGVGTVAADKFEAVAKDELKLTLKAALNDFAEEDFIIEAIAEHDGKEVEYKFGDIAVEEERNSKGNSVIIFRLLDDELNADGTITWEVEKDVKVSAEVTVRLRTSADTKDYEIKSKDAYGAPVAFSKTAFKDKIKPELVDKGIKADGKKITLTFDEKVKVDAENSALAATDFVIEADGEELDAGIDYDVIVKGTEEVDIILKGDYATFDGLVTISTAKTVKYIKDAKNDNALAEIDAEEVEVQTAPTVSGIVYGKDFSEIVITFNEEMDAATLEDVSNYVFTDKDGTVKITSAKIDDDKDKVVKLTLSGDAAAGDTVKLTDGITDYSGTNLTPVTFTFDGGKWE